MGISEESQEPGGGGLGPEHFEMRPVLLKAKVCPQAQWGFIAIVQTTANTYFYRKVCSDLGQLESTFLIKKNPSVSLEQLVPAPPPHPRRIKYGGVGERAFLKR